MTPDIERSCGNCAYYAVHTKAEPCLSCGNTRSKWTPIRPYGEVVAIPKPAEITNTSALDKQEGGSHYKMFNIQPIEFIHANNIPFIEANVIKYITRHRNKNGAQDIRKVIHYCELLLQMEYPEAK